MDKALDLCVQENPDSVPISGKWVLPAIHISVDSMLYHWLGAGYTRQMLSCFEKRCMLFSEFATSASWWSPISAYSGYKFWNVHYTSVILNPKSQQQFNYNGLNTCKMTFSLRNLTQKIRKKSCKVILHDIFSKAIALKYVFLPISWPMRVLETYLAVLSVHYSEFNELHIHKNKIQHSGKDLNLDTESWTINSDLHW